MRALVIFGTRPEAIKMCPLIIELQNHKEIECKVCLTGQHKEMLKQVMDCFGIVEDYNLDIMQKEQTLTGITVRIIEKLESILKEEQPDIVLVHGDTTTSFAAALAAFYQQIPVGHVEAGLRTGNIYSPFPEEMNRCLTGKIATYHFAPTALNQHNLQKENISENIFVTGNTVIDAFATTVKTDYYFHNEQIAKIDFNDNRIVLVTAHRRENLGKPLENICKALKRIAEEIKDVRIVYPVHLNPRVREIVYRCLSNQKNIILTEPVDVLDMHNLMAKCYIIMTDSGGLQEEAPALGKPVLVMRTETERPEAIEAGTAKLVGVDEESIYKSAIELLTEKECYNTMSKAVNPYGDGHASERIVEAILTYFSSRNTGF